MRTALRAAIRFATVALSGQRGVYETHLGDDGTLNLIGHVSLSSFCEMWGDYLSDDDDIYPIDGTGQYLGVVHCDGCFLVRLQANKAEAAR
jgi:hypothetical protein